MTDKQALILVLLIIVLMVIFAFVVVCRQISKLNRAAVSQFAHNQITQRWIDGQNDVNRIVQERLTVQTERLNGLSDVVYKAYIQERDPKVG